MIVLLMIFQWQETMPPSKPEVQDLDSHMQLRTTAIGVLPAISVCLHNIDISREVLLDPKILELETLARRMAFLTNVGDDGTPIKVSDLQLN